MYTEETRKQVEEAREDNLKFEAWRGVSDATYHVNYIKTISENLKFDEEQLFTLLMKKLEHERDIEIMNIQSRSNDFESDGGCDCDECNPDKDSTSL